MRKIVYNVLSSQTLTIDEADASVCINPEEAFV